MPSRPNNPEKRLLRISALLVVSGTALVWTAWGKVAACSFVAGGLLAAVNLFWLHHTVRSIMFSDRKRSKTRVLAGFFGRLLLIPLCL